MILSITIFFERGNFWQNQDMGNNENLIEQLKQKAAALGFSTLGIIPAKPARRLDAYLNWVDKEMYGKMGYLARPDRVVRRQDLNVILPNVASIVCEIGRAHV